MVNIKFVDVKFKFERDVEVECRARYDDVVCF